MAKKKVSKKARVKKPDNALVVVHGMGDHNAGAFKDEINSVFEEVFATYTSLKGIKPSRKMQLVPVDYDFAFEDYRNAIKNQPDIFQAIANVQTDHPISSRGLDVLNGITEQVNETSFFSTHWLDVFLYRYSLVAEPIRIKAALTIAKTIRQFGANNTCILGHSLGTAVVHDTLAKLYGEDPFDTKLSTSRDRFNTLHLVANVSRVLQSFNKTGSSIVRPGTGCCTNFIEYRHVLDPFPRIKPFDPLNNGEWVSHEVFRDHYQLVTQTEVTQANVHSIGHYLRNPAVHLPIFRSVFGFRPRSAEAKEAEEIYVQHTLNARASHVRGAFEDFDFTKQSVLNLLAAGNELKLVIERFGEKMA